MNTYIQFVDRCVVDDEAYFSHIRFNGLFKENLKTLEVSFVGVFPKENMDVTLLHRRTFCYMGVIYFIPFNGQGISFYDIEKKSFDFWHVESRHGVAKYSNAFQDGKFIYLIPAYDGVSFAVFDCEKREIQYMPQVWEQIKKLVSCEVALDVESSFFYHGIVVLSVWNENKILKINLNDGIVEKVELPDIYRLKNINYFWGKYWITLTEGAKILSCSEDFQKIEEHICENMDVNEVPLLQVVRLGENCVAIPIKSDFFWIMKSDGNFERVKLNLPDDFIDESGIGIKFLGFEVSEEGELLLYPKGGKYLLRLNNNLTDFKIRMVEFPDMDIVEKQIKNMNIRRKIEQQGMLWENESCNLHDYLRYVSDDSDTLNALMK